MTVDSKQFFHNTFDKLNRHESWGKLKPAQSSQANRTAIKNMAAILLKPNDADQIDSLETMKGVVKRWLVVNSPELDESDRKRLNQLRECFYKSKVKFNADGLNRLTDDSQAGIKALIGRGIDLNYSVEMNYEALKNFCLQVPLKIEVVNRYFIRKMFDLCPGQEGKEALAMDCIESAGFDAYTLQDLLCDQFKHLKIEDEAARSRIAYALLIRSPDLFFRYFSHFQILQESNRVDLAIGAMHSHIEWFLSNYARFNITSDKYKMQVALELSLVDPQLANEHRPLLNLTNFEHRALFDKFLFCQDLCGIAFHPEADPSLHGYQDALIRWIHTDFPAEWKFPEILVDQWRLGLFHLLKNPLDVQEAQKIVQWAVTRGILSTENFSQFEKIHSTNRMHLTMALYQQDPAWVAKNLFVIARS